MPNNKIIYFGVLIVAGTALLYVGAVFLSKIKDVLPYIGLFGILMIVIGVVIEIQKSKKGGPEGTPPVDPPA